MKQDTVFVGLDVHRDTIAVAVARGKGEVQSLGTIPHDSQALWRVVKKLGGPEGLRLCYEAGVTGYALYWELTELGVECEVVAPTLVPVKAGDRVKTDRRDAEKLARLYRSGELTAVWVPDRAQEALRDLVRARLAAKRDELRARHRLQKFLLRHGWRRPEGMGAWTEKHLQWVRRAVRFAHACQEAVLLDYLTEVEHARDRVARLERAIDEAIEKAPEAMRALIAGLQTLRGVATVTAVTVAAELGEMSRFEKPRQLMGYAGMVSREHSSGSRTRRGGITKTGNAHLRRVVVEAAWAYRHRPGLIGALRRRQNGQSEPIKAIAMKAQHRLNSRYRRLCAKGKPKQQVVTAVGRELLGFMWAIGKQVEKARRDESKSAA
jgi:transposase